MEQHDYPETHPERDDTAPASAIFPPQDPLDDLRQRVSALKAEIAKVIVGQEDMVELLLAGMLADGHVLIEGVPGVAKTLTAKLLSRCISVGFSRIQFTPDLMPSDVLGISLYDPKESAFRFRRGPIFNNIVLIDEINRAPAKTQAALFEVMEERQVSVDGHTYLMEEPFIVVATQNPVEQEGTYHLPEAQLDRFLFKINVRYPSQEEEVRILQHHHHLRPGKLVEEVQPVMHAADIAGLRESVQSVSVEERLLHYIAALVGSTRQHKSIFFGASPRASIGILNGAKAIAAIRGRDFITPEDIIYVAAPVLRHRIVLSPELEMEGADPDGVIARLLQELEIPR